MVPSLVTPRVCLRYTVWFYVKVGCFRFSCWPRAWQITLALNVWIQNQMMVSGSCETSNGMKICIFALSPVEYDGKWYAVRIVFCPRHWMISSQGVILYGNQKGWWEILAKMDGFPDAHVIKRFFFACPFGTNTFQGSQWLPMSDPVSIIATRVCKSGE